jgi:metal transporter CNNM
MKSSDLLTGEMSESLPSLAHEEGGEGEIVGPDSPQFWIFVAICFFLVLFAGLMSGLTLGLLSFEEVDLLVLMKSGTEKQRKHAKRILGVFRSQHWLLVTLLLCNAIAMEALPIFLSKISSEVVAVAVSVTAVLFFGEIFPQSICKKFGLSIGSSFSPMVRVLMYVTSAISYPLAKFLDYMIGKNHAGLMKRKQLEALVEFHGTIEGKGGDLTSDEVKIITGALSLSNKPAFMAMTPLSIVFMLPSDTVLDRTIIRSIVESGYSRIPIHVPGRREDIVGLIIAKELLLLDPDAEVPVLSTKVKLYALPRMDATTSMYDVLNIFQTGKSHMAVLTYSGGNVEIDSAIKQSIYHTDPNRRRSSGSIMDTPEDLENQSEETNLLFNKDGDSDKEPYSYSDTLPMQQDKPRIHYTTSGIGPGVIGIITIEDVLEELLQEEIVDETDKFVDNLRLQARDERKLITGLHPSLQRLLLDSESTTASLIPIIQQQNELLAEQRRKKRNSLRSSQQIGDEL